MTHASVLPGIRVDPTGMNLETVIEDPRWDDIELLANQAVRAALRHLHLDPEYWEITLLFCDDARIAALNAAFRGKAQATNVLSWPSVERGAAVDGETPAPPKSEPELGDIALAYETCMTEAKDGNIPPDHHTTHLIIHGVLHLLGYDHQRDGDADLMESTETAILYRLGVPDPYRGQGHVGHDM